MLYEIYNELKHKIKECESYIVYRKHNIRDTTDQDLWITLAILTNICDQLIDEYRDVIQKKRDE